MLNNFLKWFTPGIQIKRWAFTSLFGVAVVALGSYCTASPYLFVNIFGVVIILCGVLFIVLGIVKLTISLIAVFLPQREQDLVKILYQRRLLERGPKIVAIGGGHGLSNLLFALKEYTSNITAVVTVADNGGSSGRLREQFDVVAPGDIRNCLVALADAPALMGELFQYRFTDRSDMKGHSFGNLFLTVAYDVAKRDFKEAIDLASKVLAIRGKVIPSTTDNVHLAARYQDGLEEEGEAQIPRRGKRIEEIWLKPKNVKATPEVFQVLKEADVVILGPGSLYTSVIPNLIMEGMADAIAQSPALKIYICNVMTQEGETENFKASDHVQALIQHTNEKVIDGVILNMSRVQNEETLKRYQEVNSFPVTMDAEEIEKMGYQVFLKDILSENDLLQHHSGKLTKALIEVIEQNRMVKR